MHATIEFSAQFGGRDAASAVLPHFKALKSVAIRRQLAQFPFQSLAFILRVDGDVNSYGLSGPGNLDVHRSTYVSVDIGIRLEDYQAGSTHLVESISSSLMASVDVLRHSDDVRVRRIDFEELQRILGVLCDSYMREITA